VTWTPGAPPESSHGVYLLILDVRAIRRRYAVGVAYEGYPVCVEWFGSFGRETMRQTRIEAALVAKHAEVK
jgi:hypothetical protein